MTEERKRRLVADYLRNLRRLYQAARRSKDWHAFLEKYFHDTPAPRLRAYKPEEGGRA